MALVIFFTFTWGEYVFHQLHRKRFQRLWAAQSSHRTCWYDVTAELWVTWQQNWCCLHLKRSIILQISISRHTQHNLMMLFIFILEESLCVHPDTSSPVLNVELVFSLAFTYSSLHTNLKQSNIADYESEKPFCHRMNTVTLKTLCIL